jgi:hypothetical protein
MSGDVDEVFDFDIPLGELAPDVADFIAKTKREAEKPETTIVIHYGRGSLVYISCGRCQFDFERTKVAIGREWADEHNTKVHQGMMSVKDMTLNGK